MTQPISEFEFIALPRNDKRDIDMMEFREAVFRELSAGLGISAVLLDPRLRYVPSPQTQLLLTHDVNHANDTTRL